MSNTFELDPNEVLKHLYDLGYQNISQQQLQEFIKDLKKLMVYDITKKKQLRSNRHCDDDTSSTFPNTTDESAAPSPPPAAQPSRHRHRSEHRHHTEVKEKDLGEPSTSSSEVSAPPTRRILRECTKLLEQKNQERETAGRKKSEEAFKRPLKPSKSCDCMWRRLGCKCCEENFSKEQQTVKNAKSKENLVPPRPKSSFIKTWHMTGQQRPGSATQRSDPVTLFHQYKECWSQQKLPGENNHNDLRWSIRERMLGQNPNPRSCSCDCKSCPCKLNDVDFTNNPKKVSSKILPRGPFHIEGHILGPLGVGKDGDFVIADRGLKGVFELGEKRHTDGRENVFTEIAPYFSSHEKQLNRNKLVDSESHRQAFTQNVKVCCRETIEPESHHKTHGNKPKSQLRPELATWMSREEAESMDLIEKELVTHKQITKTPNDFKNLKEAGEELKSCKNTNNKKSCQYCGFIHHMLNSSIPQETNSHKTTRYWHKQLTGESDVQDKGAQRERKERQTDEHFNHSSSLASPATTYSSGKKEEPALNVAILEDHTRVKQKQSTKPDDYFLATVPVKLTHYGGEVKTKVEVFKKKKSSKKTTESSSSSSEMIIATKVHLKKL